MLTTVERARSWLDDSLEDSELELYIAAASSAIEARCRRNFGIKIYTETVDGVRGQYVRLRNYPIHSVDNLMTESGETLEFELAEDGSGMLFRRGGWPAGARSIRAVYTAGYKLPGEAGEPAVPRSLELACIMLIKHLQREPGITAERVGEISVTYATEGSDMPAAVKALLNPYIRVDL